MKRPGGPAIETMSSTIEPGTPSPERAAPRGRTVARTFGLGARSALRVWPLAALLALPSLAMTYAFDISASMPMSVPALLQIPLGYLANSVLVAAALPSLVRSFRDSDEAPGPYARDLRGRLAPAAVAALTSALIEILIGPALLSRFFEDMKHMPGWGLCLLVVGVLAALWLRLRILLVVAVAAIETCGPLAALRRSWRLTGGRAALLTLVGVGCVVALLWVLLFVVVGLVAGSDAFTTMTTRPWLGMVLGTALAPVFLALSAVLYHDFRQRLDAVDSERIAADAGPL
jgi:hypothetical protein